MIKKILLWVLISSCVLCSGCMSHVTNNGDKQTTQKNTMKSNGTGTNNAQWQGLQ